MRERIIITDLQEVGKTRLSTLALPDHVNCSIHTVGEEIVGEEIVGEYYRQGEPTLGTENMTSPPKWRLK